MSDTVEKIYCTDNNDALLASVMGKNNNNPMEMAAMLNNNQWMNNPFIYLVFLMKLEEMDYGETMLMVFRMQKFRDS